MEGDEVLLNHISLIPVNPAKCPKANLKDATAFLAWLTAADKGQKLIAELRQGHVRPGPLHSRVQGLES